MQSLGEAARRDRAEGQPKGVGDLERGLTALEAAARAWQEVQRRNWTPKQFLAYGPFIDALETEKGVALTHYSGVPLQRVARPFIGFRCAEGEVGLEMTVLTSVN